jgi:hypothetical protein
MYNTIKLLSYKRYKDPTSVYKISSRNSMKNKNMQSGLDRETGFKCYKPHADGNLNFTQSLEKYHVKTI